MDRIMMSFPVNSTYYQLKVLIISKTVNNSQNGRCTLQSNVNGKSSHLTEGENISGPKRLLRVKNVFPPLVTITRSIIMQVSEVLDVTMNAEFVFLGRVIQI
jgi:hypothetical protein